MGITYKYTRYEARIPSPSPSLYREMRAIELDAYKASLEEEQREFEREQGKSTEGATNMIKKALVVLGVSCLLALLFWGLGLEDIAGIFLLIALGAFFFSIVGCLPVSNTQASWVDAAMERTDIYLRIHKLANSSTDYEEFQKRYHNLYEETDEPDAFSKAGRNLGKKYVQWKNKSKK